MNKEKNLKLEDLISKEDIFDYLIYSLLQENEILRKKLNNKNLTEEEKIFDTYVFPPSSILRIIKRSIKWKYLILT